MASHGEQTIPLTERTDATIKCTLGNDIGVGDCAQLKGSYVYIFVDPEDPTQGTIRWNATTRSSHPQVAWHDTWHQHFTFLADDGTVAAFGSFDGDDMGNANQEYPVQRRAPINIGRDLWGRITKVRWTYEC